MTDNGKKHKNKEIEERARIVERRKDARNVIQEFEKIIRGNKKNNVWLPYQQVIRFRDLWRKRHLLG